MYEIYGMLGSYHESVLAREAGEWRLADEARRSRPRPVRAPRRPIAPRLLAFVIRLVPRPA